MTRRASVVSCSTVDCPSVQVVCVCVCVKGGGGGGGGGIVKEGELTAGKKVEKWGGGGGGVKAG